jgi:hypothetical protein
MYQLHEMVVVCMRMHSKICDRAAHVDTALYHQEVTHAVVVATERPAESGELLGSVFPWLVIEEHLGRQRALKLGNEHPDPVRPFRKCAACDRRTNCIAPRCEIGRLAACDGIADRHRACETVDLPRCTLDRRSLVVQERGQQHVE